MSYYAHPDEDMDPANWDCCDEHETVFPKGGACPKCEEEDTAMLSRCMSRFQMQLAMHRMGIPLKKRRHPVTDAEYQQALAGELCTCPPPDHYPDGIVRSDPFCPKHHQP